MRVGLILISVCFIAGLVAYFALCTPQPPTQEVLDAQFAAQVDALTEQGHLSSAIKLLTYEESKNGLSIELADKLDALYVKQAQDYRKKGDYTNAVDTLKSVPPDSPQFVKARGLLDEISSEGASKPRSASSAAAQ